MAPAERHKNNRDGKRHGKHDLRRVKEKRHGHDKPSWKKRHGKLHMRCVTEKNITSQLQSIDSKFVNIIVHVFCIVRNSGIDMRRF